MRFARIVTASTLVIAISAVGAESNAGFSGKPRRLAKCFVLSGSNAGGVVFWSAFDEASLDGVSGQPGRARLP